MEIDKQKLLVAHLLSDHDLYATCHGIIKSAYFDPSIKRVVNFSQEYFEKYKNIPAPEVIKAETGMEIPTRTLTKAEVKYASDQVEQFCKNKAIEAAILGAPKLLQEGDFGKIELNLKQAIGVSLNRDLGTDYFANPELRLKKLLDSTRLIPTGWRDIDEVLGGGVGRQELLLFGANSGVGKSIFMLNLAANLSAQGLNGIYFTLELSEEVVAKRLDSMLTGIGQQEIFKNIHQIAHELEATRELMGKLYIKRFPESSTNANHLRAYIKEFEAVNGFLPDYIVIDYLDLMTTNHKIPADNLFIKDKYVAEEARALGHDFDCLVISASQLGRGALEAEHIHQGHIQGGISKVNTCDNFLAIVQTEQMRAAGEYIVEYAKTRNSNGVGKKTLLSWDPIALRVTNLNKDGGKNLKVGKRRESTEVHSAGTVLDKINKSKNPLFNVLDAVDEISGTESSGPK